MERDEVAFKIRMQEEGKQLQATVNKLLLDFQQKYYFDGVGLTIGLNSTRAHSEGGAIKLSVTTNNYLARNHRSDSNIIDCTK